MTYLLHLRYPTGTRETRMYPSAFLRACEVIVLTPQPVVVTIEDQP